MDAGARLRRVAAAVARRPGRWFLFGVAAVLVLLAAAAYQGSSKTAPSSCASATPLLRRTALDAAAARRADTAGGALPAPLLDALRSDGDDLTNVIQGQQSSDLTFDERALPVTDAVTQLVGDARSAPDRTVADLGTLSSALTGAGRYCGVDVAAARSSVLRTFPLALRGRASTTATRRGTL